MPKINELEWNTALAFANVDVDQVSKADANSIFKLTQEIEALVKEDNANLAKFKIKEIGHLKDRTAILNMVKMYLSTIKQGLPSIQKFTEKELNGQLIVALQSVILASRSLHCEKLHPLSKLIGSAYGKKFVDQALRLPADQGGKDTNSKEPLTKADEQLRFLLFQNELTPDRVDLEYNRIRARVLNIPRQQVPAPVEIPSGPSGPAPIDSLMPGNGCDGGNIGNGGAGGVANFDDDIPSLAPIPVSGDDKGTFFPSVDNNANDPFPTKDICQIDNKPDGAFGAGHDPSANDKPLTMDSSIQDMLRKLSNY